MNKERIVFMGTPQFAATVLQGLITEGYNIVGVVTQMDKKTGRKQILTCSPVKEVALKYDLPIFQPYRIREEYEEILALQPDLIITCAYGQIIPEAILDYPKYHCINTHGSLLPKYRGGAPIQRAIINGDDVTGITIMYMSKGMDAGDILVQKELRIEKEDTNASLFEKLSLLALKMLLELLPDLFEGKVYPVKQKEEEVTFAFNLKKEDEFINFRQDTLTVYNHIRGLLDNPGATAVLKGKKYKLMKVGYELCDSTTAGRFAGLQENYLRIDCKDGFIKLFELRPEGKNTMDARAFYNGAGKSLVGELFKEEYE